MYPPEPVLKSRDAAASLCELLTTDIAENRFRSTIRRLHNRFRIYTTTCPAPLIAPGLIVTPEIRHQSEIYLPIAEIASAFYRLYQTVLSYPPIISSTPFHNALSWADVFAGLPAHLQFSVNPAFMLEKLLTSRDLLTQFLFASFLPRRFYGGFDRYPRQREFIREWLTGRNAATLRCLDAACGTGEDSYGLAKLLITHGFDADNLWIEGWTIEPLEVWAATHASFPHDRQHETQFRTGISLLFQRGYGSRLRFRCADLCSPPPAEPFDLILCNGLLGGPILNQSSKLEKVISNLAGLLAPGGVLLAADSFHGGWKQKCPQLLLWAFFEKNNLQIFEAGEGLGGLKSRSATVSLDRGYSEPH